MPQSLRVVAGLAFTVVLGACGGDSTSPGKSVPTHAHFYNGATPGAVGTAPPRASATVIPGNGNWLLSPDKIVLTLTHVAMTMAGGNVGPLTAVNCAVTYDRSKPGLADLGDCPFTTDTGTYTALNLFFKSTYDLTISDATTGFYTTTAGITTSAPAGGAQPFTFTVPSSTNGEFGLSPIPLATPVVVSDTSTQIKFSIVVDGLQYFRVQVAGGAVSMGWNTGNDPQKPTIIGSVGSIAKVEFYSNQLINTTGSYCSGNCGGTSQAQGIMGLGIYYADAAHPTMAGMTFNGQPATCTNLGVGFMNNPKGYMGLDATGNVGWAMPTDQSFSTYSAEMRIARVATIGGSTTLYCKNRTGDPAPPGGSYASGAPNIAIPANSIGTFILLGK